MKTISVLLHVAPLENFYGIWCMVGTQNLLNETNSKSSYLTIESVTMLYKVSFHMPLHIVR